MLAVFFALTLSTSAISPVLAEAKAPTGTIVVLGDSISAAYGIQREEGWVYLLEQYLAKNHAGWRVVNALSLIHI